MYDTTKSCYCNNYHEGLQYSKLLPLLHNYDFQNNQPEQLDSLTCFGCIFCHSKTAKQRKKMLEEATRKYKRGPNYSCRSHGFYHCIDYFNTTTSCSRRSSKRANNRTHHKPR